MAAAWWGSGIDGALDVNDGEVLRAGIMGRCIGSHHIIVQLESQNRHSLRLAKSAQSCATLNLNSRTVPSGAR